MSASFTISTQWFVESATFGLLVRSFNECFIVTDTNRRYEKPPALTLSVVYKLMELERTEMDRRVAEKCRHISKFKVSSLVGFDGGGTNIPRLARTISLAALATVAGTQLMPSAAEADMRICFPFLICPHTPPSDDGDYEPGYEGEEPVDIAPKKKTAKAAPASEASGAAVEKKAVSSNGKKTASAAAAVSCDKAGEIVSGYGFTNVMPTTCTGQVFGFNATRDGNNFVIKLNSASGELTAVNKVR